MRKKKPTAWLSLLLVFGLVAAACGDDDEPTTTDDTEADGATDDADPGDCPADEGEVIVSGSSTVQPISSRVGELLEDCGSGVLATVDGPGTGDGFELFCAGETDISDASRPIAEDEVAACEEAGIDFIELKVGIDGIAVMTSPDNAVECLSFADLYALIGPESEGFGDWIGCAGPGGRARVGHDVPGRVARHHGPRRGVGHLRLLHGDRVRRHQRGPRRRGRHHRGPDRDLSQGLLVAGRRQRHHRWHRGLRLGARLGGFAFAEEAGDGVTEIPIAAEPGGECIAPTPETIADNSYPISRNLYIYVNAALVDEIPAVGAYVDYYLSDAGIAAVEEVGYVALDAEDLEATPRRVGVEGDRHPRRRLTSPLA